jgi:hypothetical protein
MSDLPDEIEQSSQIAEELRQRILEYLDTSQQAIKELSDDKLEDIEGATITSFVTSMNDKAEQHGVWKYLGGAAMSTMLIPTSAAKSSK